MIICAMYGTGKTYLAKNRLGFIDLERYYFANRSDLFRYAVSDSSSIYGYIVLVSCNEQVLKDLKDFDKIIVVPTVDQKREYIQRYRLRGSDIKFIKNME